MQLSYHPGHTVAYIRLKPKSEEVETIRLSDDVNIDIAPDGTLYGIEFLNANAQLSGEKDHSLVIVNEVSGERTEIKLAG